MAEAFLAARYNRPGHKIIDHATYVLASDGDLMEGVSAEAASLAGHLRLGKLIVLYDNNHVSLSAATDLTFTENVRQRFSAYGWHVQSVEDGNDLVEVERAIRNARRNKTRPSLILLRTHLGYGSPNKQDTFEAHGSPLGEAEVRLTKQKLGWPLDPAFHIPPAALANFRQAVRTGRQSEAKWDGRFVLYEQAYPDLAGELHQAIQGELPERWDEAIPTFAPDPQGLATRTASGKVMNAIASKIPTFVGGSADLDPSTFTALAEKGDFESPREPIQDAQGSVGGGWQYAGSNFHFGVREHGMGSILNGMAAHAGLLPFGATFLIFSDYMRPPIRLAALMELHTIYVFTHDSLALGEDGPTHQPVEQLLGLRAIPNMLVIRPADANETATAWRIAIEHINGPVALVLTRQKLPILDLQKYPQLPLGVRSGGYVLEHATGQAPPDLSLIAAGSEVALALAARAQLETLGVRARVVSMPSWNIFIAQPAEYREAVLPAGLPMLAIEAGVSLGWRPYIGPGITVIGVDRFGASAPGSVIMNEYGFNIENVVRQALELVKRSREA
jgi:transketolase